MAWVSYLDDTYWKDDGAAATFVWDGPNGWWDISAGSGDMRLVILTYGAGWQVGFRPTHVRITYQNSVPFAMSLRDGNGDYQCNESDYVSGTEVALSYGGEGNIDDLYRIYVGGLGDYADVTIEITDIEFFEEDPTTTTTTTTTTTAPVLPKEVVGSQGGGSNLGVINEGFGGFGFGWG